MPPLKQLLGISTHSVGPVVTSDDSDDSDITGHMVPTDASEGGVDATGPLSGGAVAHQVAPWPTRSERVEHLSIPEETVGEHVSDSERPPFFLLGLLLFFCFSCTFVYAVQATS